MERRRWVAMVMVVAASACVHRSHALRDFDGQAVRVVVVNHYSLSMEVYATSAGINQRLGLVDPGTTRTFVLPQALVSSGGRVTLLARPTGIGPVARSGELDLSPGDVVDFDITLSLVDTRATVRM